MWHWAVDNRLYKLYCEASALAGMDRHESALAAYQDVVARAAMAAERGLPVTSQFIAMAMIGIVRSLLALGQVDEAELSLRELEPYLHDFDAASALTV